MKIIIALFIFPLLLPLASAHEAFTSLIGNIKVEVAPNFISPILRQNFTASVTFTDLNSNKELYLPYNVTIYNETAQIYEIDNLIKFLHSVMFFIKKEIILF